MSTDAAASGRERPPKTRWDTAYVKPEERFSYFREGVCQAYMNLTPLRPDNGPFNAVVETAALDDARLSEIDTAPHGVTRTKQDFSNLQSDCFMLGLVRTGHVIGVAAGEPFEQEPKQVFLASADAIERFDIMNAQRFSSTLLYFEKSKLRDIKSKYSHIVLDKMGTLTIASCMNMLGEKFTDGPKLQLNCLAEAAISLLNAHLVGDPEFFSDLPSLSSASKGILVAIKEYTILQLADPSLTTEKVAMHFGISARYVQKLFANEQQRFYSFLIDHRLEQVAKDLLDQNIRATATDIALRWGFRDMTTFYRNFRRRFGDTPKQMLLRKSERGRQHSFRRL